MLPRFFGAGLMDANFKGCSEVYDGMEWAATQRLGMTGYSSIRH